MKRLLFAAVVVAGVGLYAEEGASAVPTVGACAAEGAETESDSGFWAEAGVDFMSDYMWRGVILNDNWCWQPSVSIGYDTEVFGGIYFNYWASLDLTHRRNNCGGGGNSRRCMGIQEQDFYIGYTKDFGDFEFEIGWYFYDYPYNGPDHRAGALSHDLYLSGAYRNPFITPRAELFWSPTTQHDHDAATAYLLLSMERDFAVTDTLKITPRASVGMGDTAFVQNNTGYVRDNSGMHTQITDQTLTLKATYALADWCSLVANINYTWIPSRTLRHQRYMTCGDDNHNQQVWGGVNVTFSF
ncbi:MAG: TorF family putative porin [Kiritimatiellia bacterium]